MPALSPHTSQQRSLTEHDLRSEQRQQILDPEDARRVWIVRSGIVDLFYQKMAGGEYGARFHIASFHAGQAIFGMDLQEHGGLSLVGVLHPDAEVECLSRAVFRRHNTLSETLSPMLLAEEWVHTLSEACAGSAPPRACVVVAEGNQAAATETALCIAPESMISFARLLEGEASLFGCHRIAAAMSAVPLSRRAQSWLQLEPGSTVLMQNFAQMFFSDLAWDWLEAFHSLVLAALLKKREVQEENWKAGLREQQASDALIAHRALQSLASTLTAPLNGAPSRPLIHSDAMLAACKILEPELGIEFKAGTTPLTTTTFRAAVESIAHASAVRQRQVALRGRWWMSDSGVLLGMRTIDKRPLALIFRTSGHYECYDPVEATWRRVDAEVAASLSATAFLFYKRFPLRSLGVWELVRLALSGSRRDLLRVAALGVAGGLLSLAVPVTTGIIFDSVIPGAERAHLAALTGLLVVIAITMGAFALVRNIATLRIEARIDAVAQSAIWDRLLRLPVPFFRRFSSGDLALRSLAINQIRMILTNATLSALLSGLFSFFNLILLFVYSSKLAWLALGITAIFFAITIFASLTQLRYTRQVARIRGRISSTLLQFMNGITKLRVTGAEDRAYGVWAFLFSQQKQLHLKARTIAARLTVLRSIYPQVALGILFFVAAPAVGAHSKVGLSTGSFLAVIAAFTQFIYCSIQFTSAFPSLIAVVPVFERMMPILETAPEVEEGSTAPGTLRGAIEASHLTFRYDSHAPMIVRDVSFTINPGEFVAFTGPSGSGKSTLLRLLLGFEIPETGSIHFDGQNLRSMDVQAVRRQIGVVLQSGRLVSGSIFENIIGSLPLTHDDAWEAARMSGLDADIKAMPMGMHTFVNDGGVGLSGGQRQRLMIARAIVSKPRILLFDEATSALDNATQAIVSRSLETLRATRVVIAHRLSTIQNADRIYVFDNGKIVQTGHYSELANTPGLFQSLVRRQTL